MAATLRRTGLLCLGLASALFLNRGSVIAGAAAAAGPVHLVHDFFPGEFEGDRPLPQLTRLGETLFFVAAELEAGQTVWRTDGTAAGSHRVPIAGASGLLDEPKIIGTVGGRIFWSARSAADPERRVLLAAGESGDAAVLTTCLAAAKPLGQRLFFLSCNAGEHGIWSTDGTAAGTGPVPSLAGQSDGAERLETLASQWLVFSKGSALLAWDVARDRVLRLLEGREIGTIQPTGETLFIITGDKNALRQRLWASRLDAPRALQLHAAADIRVAGWRDGRLYFGPLANPGDSSVRLWSTDGTRAGTRPYTGLQPDAFGFLAGQLGAIGSTTLVPMPGYYSGGLLAADETKREVREIVSACKGKYPCLASSLSAVTVIGGQAFEAINHRLVRTDGTAEGSVFGSGLVQVDAASLGAVEGHLLLGAIRQGVQQLWETDGTATGTRALSDGTRDRPFRVQGPPISYNGALFVAADRKPVGQQLWRIAGGRAEPVTDLRHLATGVSPFQALAVGGRTLLVGAESYGWKSVAEDGSVESITDYDDICSQAFDPCPTPTITVGRRRVFAGSDGALWSTDGTAAGTARVNAPNGGAALEPIALGRLGDGALVLTRSGGLWSSDGSPEDGSRFIAQLPFNPNHPERFQPIFAPIALGASTFLFRRAPGPGGPGTAVLEVWRTDGTAAGTLRLASTPFLDSYSSELSPVVEGGRLFFRFGGTLWTSDGSVAGTHPLSAQLPGGTFALAAGSGTLYAGAGYQDADEEHETLWAIDPATLTASLLGTFPQVSSGAVGANLGSVLGDTLFFGVNDPQGQTPEKVWLTEGTAASTRPLPDPLSSLTAASFFTLGDRRYFAACEAEHGCELWSADRLGETPQLVADLWPGSRGSDPEILAADGKSLLFAATEPATGRELWKLDLTAALAETALNRPPLPLLAQRLHRVHARGRPGGQQAGRRAQRAADQGCPLATHASMAIH
jgi:ELWxxDGT repeat protein